MSKRSYAELLAQDERRSRRSAKWNWPGWIGTLCLLSFASFLFFPEETDVLKSQPASVLVIAAMVASVVLPAVAALRSGNKRWWIASGLGALAAAWFIWVVVG